MAPRWQKRFRGHDRCQGSATQERTVPPVARAHAMTPDDASWEAAPLGTPTSGAQSVPVPAQHQCASRCHRSSGQPLQWWQSPVCCARVPSSGEGVAHARPRARAIASIAISRAAASAACALPACGASAVRSRVRLPGRHGLAMAGARVAAGGERVQPRAARTARRPRLCPRVGRRHPARLAGLCAGRAVDPGCAGLGGVGHALTPLLGKLGWDAAAAERKCARLANPTPPHSTPPQLSLRSCARQDVAPLSRTPLANIR